MRRLTIAFLVTCLLAVGAGPSVAQEPSPTPAVGVQRVEVPEAGIALTVPHDWVVDTPMQEVLPGVVQVLKALKSGSGGCWLGMAFTDDPIALRDFTDGVMLPFRLHPEYEVSNEMTDVSLPVGPALRGYMVQHFPEGDLHQAPYSLATPNGFAFLNCIGYTRPDDDWLSIAETIEFLPVEE